MPFQHPQMKKRMTIMIVGLLVVFGGIIAFNLIKSFMIKHYFAHFELPAVSVSSVVATARDWEPKLVSVGNFVAPNGVDINAQVPGNVVNIYFQSGEYIKKNQPLIDIDDSVEQATLKFNQADLALQEVNYKRQKDLIIKGATAISSVDEAYAKLLEAQANMEKTQAIIRQKHITTPFAGKLGIRQIDLGQYITPGQTSIVALQSMDPLFLEFYLPEQLLSKININQNITFSVEQNHNLHFKGKITAINAKIDTNTHTIKVQATLPNCPLDALKSIKNSALITVEKNRNNEESVVLCNSDLNAKNNIERFNFMPGMFASIDVEQPTISHVITLPSTAISYTLYGNSVFVIEKDAPKADSTEEILRVRRVFISTGAQQGNETVITSGIKDGQMVVSAGELKLQDGTRVIINNDVKLQDIKNPDLLGQ